MIPRILLALSFTTVLAAQQSTDIQVSLSSPLDLARPGSSVQLVVIPRNQTQNEYANVDIVLTLQATHAALKMSVNQPGDWYTCTNDGPRTLRCRMKVILRPSSHAPLLFEIEPATEGRFELAAQAFWNEGLFSAKVVDRTVFYREVLVTSSADAGSGSLRAAIDHVNDVCARDEIPCAIRFRIAETLPASGWYTIKPFTPLPAITAGDVLLVRDRDTPPVELDGSLLTAGHGLALRGSGPASIEGLSIGGFPWDGISIARPASSSGEILFNRLGLRPDDRPNGNGSRGITIDAPSSGYGLHSNRISSNRRSGVFVAGGTDFGITGNQVSNNGASGVYAGPNVQGLTIMRNYFGGNAHAAISIAAGAVAVKARQNVPGGNGGLLIDHDLDGFSGYTRTATHLPAPRIAATYDAATNTTVVTGTFDAPDPTARWQVDLYPGFSWWESFYKTLTFTGTTFTYTYTGRIDDWITATVEGLSDPTWSTSEHSEAVTVR